MSYANTIALMKKASFDEAFSSRIGVFDKKGKALGSLVPVGVWILAETKIVAQIQFWRQRAMKMFLTQFESTFDKTFNYLKNLAIEQSGRLFFLMYDENNRFCGHMGIIDVDGKRGAIDNLMRGVDGGHPQLVYFSEIALLHWCFKSLDLVESDLKALSYNWLVLALHEQVGYKIVEKIPLKRMSRDGAVFHEETNAREANVEYFYAKMRITKNEFYEANHWLK